jgi:hypothetical protein
LIETVQLLGVGGLLGVMVGLGIPAAIGARFDGTSEKHINPSYSGDWTQPAQKRFGCVAKGR